MLKYKNVLVTADFSDASKMVTDKAQEIGKETGANLHIIHVIEHSAVAYGGEFAIPLDANLEQSIEDNAATALGKIAEQLGIPEDRRYMEAGSVKYAVTEKAKEINADLIIVGTHGHHGLDLLLGSRANAILHGAKCDVLVVKIKE